MKGNHALLAQIRQRDDELTRLRASLATAEAKLADAEKHADSLDAALRDPDSITVERARAAHAARRAARDGQEGTR